MTDDYSVLVGAFSKVLNQKAVGGTKKGNQLVGHASTFRTFTQTLNAPESNALFRISDKLFNDPEMIESPFAELIGRYHPDPNNTEVQSIVESNPDSNFACGIGRNSFLDCNQEWVNDQVLMKDVSLFSIGVAGNENYTDHQYDGINLFRHHIRIGINGKLTPKQQRKNLFLEALASRKNLPSVDYLGCNSLYNRVIANKYDLDTLVARGYGKNPVIDPDDDSISSLVRNKYDTEFACGVAQNPRLNFQSEMVREAFLNYPESKFVLGLAHHPRMSPDIDLNMIRLKKDDPAYKNFFLELDKNPHYQLRKALKQDLTGLEQAIRANPEEAKTIPLGRLLLEEGIVSLAA